MKTKEEIKQFLLENATNEYGLIDLSNIDFGNLRLNFSGIKAETIDNYSQKAETIYNHYQEAKTIYNRYQKAETIDNYSQKAETIYNRYQKAEYIHNHSQEAETIYNHSQEAEHIDNVNNAIMDEILLVVFSKEDTNQIENIKCYSDSNKLGKALMEKGSLGYTRVELHSIAKEEE
jgi:hypothetical protein